MAGLIHFRNPDTLNDIPVSAGNPLPTALAGGSAANPNANPAAPWTGQQATTTTAAALPSQALVSGVVVKALSGNAAAVYVGAAGVTTTSGYPLAAGEAISVAVQNANAIYILGANTTDKVAFAGS